MSRILRIVAVPLLCALFALSSIANARVGAEKSGLIALNGGVQLCLSAGGTGPDTPPDHDCDACCLTTTKLVPPPGFTQLAPAVPVFSKLRAYAPGGHADSLHQLPWSRGPPGIA